MEGKERRGEEKRGIWAALRERNIARVMNDQCQGPEEMGEGWVRDG